MAQKERGELDRRLQALVGSRCMKIGRAGAMIWLSFTAQPEKEYALHCETQFRIKNDERVLIAKGDLYQPSKTVSESPSFDWERFEWDAKGLNRFDAWVKSDEGRGLVGAAVQSVEIGPYGDLLIHLERGIAVELLVDVTGGEECWRFFEKDSEHHTVMTGRGIELQ